MINIHDMYNTDEEFKEYVDKCAQSRHLDIYTILQTKLVLYYAEYLIERRKDKLNEGQDNSNSCE